MTKAAPGVRQRHTRRCTRPPSGCRCGWEWHYEGAADPLTGRRNSASRRGYATMREAKAARAAWVSTAPTRDVSRRKVTVGEWLSEWHTAKTEGAGRRLKPSTATSYGDHISRFLTPRIGRRPLAELTAADITKCFTSIRSDHPQLSPASVGRVYATLRGALNGAVRSGLLQFNPCARTELTSNVAAPKVRPWTPEELAAFLSHPVVQQHRWFSLLLLLATTGLRRGEACGLRWSDVDIEGRLLRPTRSRTVVDRVVHEGPVKTGAGEDRAVGIDATTASILDEWRTAQQREAWDWNDDWRGSSDPYVFTEHDGRPIDPEKITRNFGELCVKAGLRRVRLHDLRHGVASTMLRASIPLLVVSRHLGHSSISITADIYTHLDPQQSRSAVDAAAALVGWTRAL